ncbi:hypothetical protein ACFOED_14965 [Vulcaniibacterium thermophilum]|uniref:hypothetical protein n=1 Tax=Vulcaniibacterium thermophilum TaxID=1169913 RepID=UPI003608C377
MTLGKVLAGLVAIAVAMVVLKALQDRPADPQEVKEAMAAGRWTRCGRKPTKRHPNLAKSEALQAVAAERASAQLAQQTGDKRALTAASLFYGFYFVNTRARPEYCRSHGWIWRRSRRPSMRCMQRNAIARARFSCATAPIRKRSIR